jgi:hypothetical protein
MNQPSTINQPLGTELTYGEEDAKRKRVLASLAVDALFSEADVPDSEAARPLCSGCGRNLDVVVIGEDGASNYECLHCDKVDAFLADLIRAARWINGAQ